MKNMLDILKENLPEGAEFLGGKQKRGKFLYTFKWLGHECSGEILTSVAPGYEKKHVIQSICADIAGVYMDMGDIEKCKIFLEASAAGKFPSILTGLDNTGIMLYTFELKDYDGRTITIKMPGKNETNARLKVNELLHGGAYSYVYNLVDQEEYR